MLSIIVFLTFNFISRLSLYSFALFEKQIDFSVLQFMQVILFGLLNDVVTLSYVLVPLVLISCLFKRINKYIKYFLYFGLIQALCFLVVAEFTFWLEFSTRFNFIAVDYLVYTHEIFGNVKESYPVFVIFPLMFLIGALIYSLLFSLIRREQQSMVFKRAIVVVFISVFCHCFYNPKVTDIQENNYLSELAKNGIYNLFSAFLHNSIDYNNLYSTKNNELALEGLYSYVAKNHSLERFINNDGEEKNYNIILITVESLSAEFLNTNYEEKPITPYLKELIKEGIYFNNFYATGTRTVRGLEALTLSIPPLPGQSILRRANNKQMFSIASVLKKRNYDIKFIYGGYGYFDNMNDFFANNNFKIIDRKDIPEAEVEFANIWGISDEDLYKQVLKQADKSFANNSKFFSLVLTTSNHRPYTYPEGKIDIPSHSNRQGGVKYTDYALNKFIKEASAKPWFNNTIFVITADHCAGSAGKSALPPKMYRIPLLIYAPNIIKPKIVSNIASQIDLAPTILGLLNIAYKSKFFGNDIFKKSYQNAFIGTFQKLGYIENNKLIVLSPVKQVQTYNLINNEPIKTDQDFKLINRAIDYYQSAYYLYQNGKLKEND